MTTYLFVIIFFGSIYLLGIIYAITLFLKRIPPVKRIPVTMKANAGILITGCLMIAAARLFDVNYLNYKAPMPYSHWKEISYLDFRGLNRPGYTLDGMNDFAYIESNFEVQYHGQYIDVTTYFYPSRSYVFNNKLEYNDLLTHELYHLHITEYGARLLRQALTLATKPIPYPQLTAMKKKYRAYSDSLQIEYDDQTYHSYVVGKQKKWQYTIDSCLESLKKFEETTISNR